MINRKLFFSLALVCVAIFGFGFPISANAISDDVKIDSNRAIKKITGNWYDSKTESYEPPVLSKSIDDSIRQYGWINSKKPAQPKKPWRWNWANLGLTGELFGWLVFGALGLVLIAGLIAIAYYYFQDYIPVLSGKSSKKDAVKVDMTKVVDLPFEVPTTNDDPLSHAEALMRSGRYNEAVVYLYGYMLLALDQARKIHLQKGKTNRMYLRELRNEHQLQSIVNKTMLAFEDVFFGRYDIDRARFEVLWAQRDEFHRLLQPVENAAIGASVKVAPV